MKLVIATPSPYARKARVALREKGLEHEETVDNPWNAGTQSPAHNPLGQVPILLLEDGRTYYGSGVIIEFLDTLQAEPRMIPTEPDARVAVRQIEALADGICDAVVLTVLEESRKPELQSADWVARQAEKISAGVTGLAELLGDKNWLVGDGLTLADVAAGCTLGYIDIRLPDDGWRQRHPNLASYSDRLEARPAFAETQPKPQIIQQVS